MSGAACSREFGGRGLGRAASMHVILYIMQMSRNTDEGYDKRPDVQQVSMRLFRGMVKFSICPITVCRIS